MTTCTRRIQFCAGHRVYKHESKCANPHGHNYVALFKAEAPLDDIGRVIDFSVLKDRIGGWIEKHWDHAFIYWIEDTAMEDGLVFAGEGKPSKVFAMPTNPTAENMAEYLLHEVSPVVLKDTGVRIIEVTIWETENCFATARLN